MKLKIKLLGICTVLITAAFIMTGCSIWDGIPFLSEKAVDSIAGAFEFVGNIFGQVKDEGIDSFLGEFDDEDSSNAPSSSQPESSQDDSAPIEGETSQTE